MTLTVSQIRALVAAGEISQDEGAEMIAERAAALNEAAGTAKKPTAKATTTAKKSETVAAPPSTKKPTAKATTTAKKPTAKKEEPAPKEKKEPVPPSERPPFLTIEGAEAVDKYCPRQIVYMGRYGDLGLPSFKVGKSFFTYSDDVWGHMLSETVFGGSRFAEFAISAINGTWDNETQSATE